MTPSDSFERIHLSVPHMSGHELAFIRDAFESNWVAPLGPHVNAFEREFRELLNAEHAVALASGTGALHLAYQLLGVGKGDIVLIPSLTFAATANPVLYLGGCPIFIDSERESWNVDPDLVETTLKVCRKKGRVPKVLVAVHLYGQSANLDPLISLCEHYGVALVEDAAEALGGSYRGRALGTFGEAGVFSFNGNKVITTSGGGMLISPHEQLIAHALKLATQAREPVAHYEHEEIGYNYRMSNILAAIGRGQLRVLEDHVGARRRNFEFYKEALGDLPGLDFMPEAPWGTHSRWLTTLTIDPLEFGMSREELRLALEAENIEARPVWKPMHLQPVFAEWESVGGEVAEDLFRRGLCLPSSSSLTTAQLERVALRIREVHSKAAPKSSRSRTSPSNFG